MFFLAAFSIYAIHTNKAPFLKKSIAFLREMCYNIVTQM